MKKPKYKKSFRLKAKGTFVGSQEYIYIRENGKVKEFYRKVDAVSYKKNMMRNMRQMNRQLPKSQHKCMKCVVTKK